MTDYVHEVLDDLVPRFDDEPVDWQRVLVDADEPERLPARRRSWRRLVVVAVAVVVLATPLLAAASREWWFFRFPDPWFQPITDVSVVKTGTWDGKPWELTAYLSERGLCFALTPSGSGRTGGGGALSCAWIQGLPSASRPPEDGARLTITVLSGSSIGFPPYAVGPVVDAADEVEIHFADGTVVRTPTFDAPDELGAIRFYATELEEAPFTGRPPTSTIGKLVGLTSDGEIVACLVSESPAADLSACE